MIELVAVICSRNDRRVCIAIDKLVEQVDYLLVIDSSTKEEDYKIVRETFRTWQDHFVGKSDYTRFDLLWRPGLNLAQAKNTAVRILLNYSGADYIAFIDADMYVSAFWGPAVRARLEQDAPDILVGMRIPNRMSSQNEYERAMERQHFFDFRNPSTFIALPQDNTIWSRKALETIGPFDERFAHNGEDVEYGIRAQSMEFKPMFDANVVAYHDHSTMNNVFKVLKKKLDYMVGGAMAHMKHETLPSRARLRKVYHPLQLLDYPMMVLAVFIAKVKLGR